ncbi:MAG TPA: redoxin family protein [Patescibacteria group bacterium]|jgi:thiol-disulfide isomerase/thioredoxin|nr:redoxin family protein [Patescibacteria group bacterium]
MTKSKTTLKRLWPFILILIAIAVGGAWYIHISRTKVPVISAALDSVTDTKDPEPEQPKPIVFKNYGPAPELTGITKWFNGDPQTLAGLKGKVTVVDFWTYSSINSTRTIPYLVDWQKKYQDNGLAIIGVHTPEYAFEKIPDNLTNAIKSHGINYPIAQDNDYKTWSAYHNQFWPALYLIDRAGNIVYTYYGEGNYADIEKAVRTVLGLEGDYNTPPVVEQDQSQTPQIYLGLAKLSQLGNSEKPSSDPQIFSYPKKLGDGKFAIEGQWAFNQEAAIHTNGFARIKLNFNAAKVFLVAQSPEPTTIRVYVDGVLVKGVVVTDSQLYQLYDSISGGPHTMEIEVPDNGFQASTFTFG